MSQNTHTRREFMQATGLSMLGLSLNAPANLLADGAIPPAKELTVYIGTYTTGKSEGIYQYRLDPASGMLKPAGVTKEVANPSFLAISPGRKHLYAVNEIKDYEGKKSGSVSAFAVDAKTGALKFLNRQPTEGAAPCHVIVDTSGKFVLVANYSGGNAIVFPVKSDGSLGPASDRVQHVGKGPDQKRQEGPHTHNVMLDKANRYAYISDLGIDKVMIYKFDSANGKLSAGQPFAASMPPGAGPRHFTFHPGGQYGYVINELNSTITAFAIDQSDGSLKELQTVPTLPSDFSGESYCADIHVSPNGKFLYGSNRGHDSIVVYAIDAGTGKLTYVAHTPVRGKWPRNFTIDLSGSLLLVANQHTSNVVSFRIDPQTGKLTATGSQIEVPDPVCILVVPA